MALQFYIHGMDAEFDRCYANYTNGQDWNAAPAGESALFAATLNKARTEEGLKEILTCMASKFMLGKAKLKKQGGGTGASDAVAFLDLVSSSEASLCVLKGVHQESDPHISVSFAGWLYHVNVKGGRQGQANLYTVVSVSEGSAVKDAPGGWTPAK